MILLQIVTIINRFFLNFSVVLFLVWVLHWKFQQWIMTKHIFSICCLTHSKYNFDIPFNSNGLQRRHYIYLSFTCHINLGFLSSWLKMCQCYLTYVKMCVTKWMYKNMHSNHAIRLMLNHFFIVFAIKPKHPRIGPFSFIREFKSNRGTTTFNFERTKFIFTLKLLSALHNCCLSRKTKTINIQLRFKINI